MVAGSPEMPKSTMSSKKRGLYYRLFFFAFNNHLLVSKVECPVLANRERNTVEQYSDLQVTIICHQEKKGGKARTYSKENSLTKKSYMKSLVTKEMSGGQVQGHHFHIT